MDYWKDKIAVVTGASAGIGAQILTDLAKSGLIVIGLARRVEKIQEIAEANKPAKIFARECDISEVASIEAAFKWITETFGKVHIIINNAAAPTKPGETLSPALSHEEITRAINTNLTGLVICTREAYKLMMNHDENAYIINMNSVRGHVSPIVQMNFTSVYSATKFAVTNHTETIRLDLGLAGNKRIRVTSLSPGLVRTERAEKIAGPYSDFYEKTVHLMPKDVSDAVLYLLSTPPHVNVSELTIEPTGEVY
ncbi:farnesol dehydrogenase-like [Culicoides brevitarsis]|uniref:farnesol dehydrogenase-like n=1 Tax=Culicoides brevitarsis TaxID=469753 RepID=UPI00307C4345